MCTMGQVAGLADVLPPARFTPYVVEACGDRSLAEELYRWNARLAGAWHVHLGHIEICLRHTMDHHLQAWNSTQRAPGGSSFPTEWTSQRAAAPLLHSLIGDGIAKARDNADKDAHRRPSQHPRYRAVPTHDDVVAQLMFGAWSRLLLLPGRTRPTASQRQLWNECLNGAFPHSKGSDPLVSVGRQVEGLRGLRNRIAHHENLLTLDTAARLNGSLALLRSMDTALPELIMKDSQLRRIANQDPRG